MGLTVELGESAFSMGLSRDLETVRRRYRWLAPIYPFFELVFLLPRGIRNKAVERLGLTAEDTVLEVGCGTGRNLPHLVAAVGAKGRVCIFSFGISLWMGSSS